MGWHGAEPMEWARQSQARLTAVFRGAVEMLARDMTASGNLGGRLPVLTGNLQRSLLMSTTAMPMQSAPGTVHSNPQVTMAGVQAGQTVWLGFQANYAARQNYGFVGTDSLGRTYNQSGFGFIEAAIANWPTIVAAEATYVRSKVMARGA